LKASLDFETLISELEEVIPREGVESLPYQYDMREEYKGDPERGS